MTIEKENIFSCHGIEYELRLKCSATLVTTLLSVIRLVHFLHCPLLPLECARNPSRCHIRKLSSLAEVQPYMGVSKNATNSL